MTEGSGVVYRFRIQITVGPTDRPLIEVFRWMIGVLMRVHDDPPGPVGVRVEQIPADSE